jgi:hypothetical protein
VIPKVAGISGEIRIHNIPPGRYRFGIKANGKTVKIKDTQKYNPTFGMSPAEPNGTASILFVADSAPILPMQQCSRRNSGLGNG